MTFNALNFESDLRTLITLGDLDGALAFIRFLVDHVRFDPAATGVTLGSPALDRLCGEIGAQTLGEARRQAAHSPATEPADIVIVATELYALGGHSRVIADLIATQPDKRHRVVLTNFFDSADPAAAHGVASPSVRVDTAAVTGRVEKLLWLQTELARHPAAQIFVFNHHGDAAAIAALQPGLNREVVFCHHADYHLCLGTHVAWTRHVDFFAPCQHRCSEAGIHAEYWPLSVPDRGCRSHEAASFGQGATFTSCTSGVWSKFESQFGSKSEDRTQSVYPFHYAELVADILHATGGRHVHIGGIPDDALARIRANLDAQGVARERFQHIAQVPSLWDALLEERVDLYIGSFPFGGGRAVTEALGAGVPIVTHRHQLDPLLGGCGLGPPDTWNWSSPTELQRILSALTTTQLAARSRAARDHYLQHHAPEIFAHCVRTGDSVALPTHVPQNSDRLVSYLLRSAMREEGHTAVTEELRKRVQAVRDQALAKPTDGAVAGTLAHAIALFDAGQLDEAGAAFTALHAQQPAEPQILVHLGLIALQSGMPQDACVFFDHATHCSEDSANTEAAIGQRCLQLNNTELAIHYLQAALARNPGLVGALALLADALQRQGDAAQALNLLNPLLQPGTHTEVLLRIIRLANITGDQNTELTACLAAHQFADCHSRALFLMAQRDDVSAAKLLEETRRFVATHANTPRTSLPAGARTRLRVGFVMGRLEAGAPLERLESLLCELDAQHFDTLLFFDQVRDETGAQRISLVVDESHAVTGLSASEAAALVQSRRVDILVDLAWHAHLPATLLFSQRAAPVQINASQPPRSSALANMDYVASDAGAAAEHFTESMLDWQEPQDASGFGQMLLSAWQRNGGSLARNT